MNSSEQSTPRFCGQCGASLPPGQARFCIECGHPVKRFTQASDPAPPVAAQPASTGPTVQLSNARTQQLVVGGTAKLPSSGAAPPGLWFASELPGPDDIIAIYAPLRAIVGGWSGLIDHGWEKLGQEWAGDGTSRDLVRFAVERVWFAAPDAAQGMTLHIRINAASHAEEGRTRRGFRYRIGADPPMEVAAAWWVEGDAPRHDLPVPQIQIMAPPRIPRVSDYDETIRRMNAREAEIWSQQGEVRGMFRIPNATQQRTLVGRGIPLLEVSAIGLWFRLGATLQRLYRVQIFRPITCQKGEWAKLKRRIKKEAAGLGLDMNADAMIEWWLDREGYDGAVLERGAHQYDSGRAVIAFRRSQIVMIEP